MNDILDIKEENLDKNGNNGDKNAKKDEKKSKKDKIITSLAITAGVFGVLAVGFGVGYAIVQTQALEYKDNLENIYESNFYSLLDNVNNLDNKLSKTLNSSASDFQRKTLLEASKNASEAEIAVASLPLNPADIHETVKMVNQISGYTSTLSEKLVEGTLSQEDYQMLQEIYQSVNQLKINLNEFARKLNAGYSIIDGSISKNYEASDFAISLSTFKDNDITYPSMIYDGPFSDSVVNSEIKGLHGERIKKSEAQTRLQKFFKNASSVEYESETTGRFDTYNFRVFNSENEILFVQVSQIGGYILTISGAGENGKSSTSIEDAREIALNFAVDNGIESPQIVWSDSIDNDVYFNITPTQNGIILYPDLVKVKVNLTSGTVVGYDSTSYFTNHTQRNLSRGDIKYSQVSGKIPSNFELLQNRLALVPLDYNREVVCIEVEATENGSRYYFYFNDIDGKLENVLKVIETDNGNLLM